MPRFIILAVLYAICAYGAFSFLRSPEGISVIWPASGVFLAALLMAPRSQWWLVACGLCIIDFSMAIASGGISLLPAIIFALISTAQAVMSAILLRRFVAFPMRFDVIADVHGLLLWGCSVPVAIAAAFAALASYSMLNGVLIQSYLWWLISNGLGVLVVTPLVILWAKRVTPPDPKTSVSSYLELSAMLAILWLVTRYVFTIDNPSGAALAVYSYLPYPVLIWAGIRFGVKVATLATFIFVVTAIWYDALVETGGFESVRESLISLEIYLIVGSGLNLLIAVLFFERSNVDETLRLGHERLQLALQSGEDGLWDWDIGSNKVYYSSGWKKMLGYKSNEFENTLDAYLSIVHPDDIAAFQKKIQTSLENSDAAFETEVRLHHKRGHWVNILSRGQVEREHGKPVRFIGTHVDISSRKKAEQALIESEKNFRQLIEFAPIGILLSIDRKYVFTNSAGAKILGLEKAEDIIGKNITHFHHPDYVSPSSDRVEKLMSGEIHTWPQFTVKVIRATGEERVLEAMSTTTKWQGQKALVAVINDVSERIEVQENLSRNAHRLEQAQALGEIGDWELDVLTGEVYWSDQLYRLFDRNPELGPPSYEEVLTYYFPEDAKRLDSQVRRATETGESYEFDLHIRMPSGREAYHFAIGNTLKNDQGKVIKQYGIAQDITRRKLAEDALKKSEANLASAQALAKVGSWEMDLTSDEVNGSREYQRLHGLEFSSDSISLDIIVGIIHPDDRQYCLDKYAVLLKAEGRATMVMEYRVIWPDGSIHCLDARGEKLSNDGYFNRMIGTVQDITDRKLYEESLLTSEERYRALITSSNTGAWEYFSERDDFWCSEEYYSMLGRDINDPETGGKCTLENSWLELLHPDDRELARKRFVEYLRDPQGMYEDYYRMLHKDGHWVWVWSRGKTLRDSSGKHTSRTIGTHIDITTQRRTEEQLRHTQKIEALGKLTGGIAHDYNNMLNVVLGYSRLLMDSLKETPELVKYTNEIIHAGERGVKLTKKLLSYTRKRQTDAEPVNINAVLLDGQHMLEKTLTARIDLVLDLEESLWPVWIDTSDLEDAILNLSINAMHAMEHGGKLTFSTRNETITSIDGQYLGLSKGDYVQLSVADTGIGMCDDVQTRMFDPFFSTKGDRGSGLGLSQVHGFMVGCHGTIRVYSEPGHGTRLILYFPRYEKGQADLPGESSASITTLFGSETILVVDDEVPVVELAEAILLEYGYRVLKAGNGEMALEVLARENVDLIITDIIMPKMDGYELAAMVKQKYPGMPIQLCSGFADDRHAEMVDAELQRNLLHKPYTPLSLVKSVKAGLLNRTTAKPVNNNNEKDMVSGSSSKPEPGKRHLVMVMDDDESISELYKIDLEKLGCKVILTRDGDEAISTYQSHLQRGDCIDLVILDLTIPGSMGGVEVASRIRKVHSAAKIVVSSGNPEDEAMLECEKFGFDASLDKNFNKKSIKAMLRKFYLITD